MKIIRDWTLLWYEWLHQFMLRNNQLLMQWSDLNALHFGQSLVNSQSYVINKSNHLLRYIWPICWLLSFIGDCNWIAEEIRPGWVSLVPSAVNYKGQCQRPLSAVRQLLHFIYEKDALLCFSFQLWEFYQ